MSIDSSDRTVLRTAEAERPDLIAPAATRAASPRRLRRGRSRETVLFLIGIALIAIHVLDDNFVQPQRGMSPGDHIVSGLVPLALLGLAAWAYPRLSGGRRGALALIAGPLAIAAGSEGFYYTQELGTAGDDFTGLLCLPAGVLLLVLGAVGLWRARRTEGSLWWRYPRRALIALAAVVPAFVVVSIGIGYGTTHTGRAVVPPDRLGVAHEDVKFTTADGLELEGWYIPSKNGAAVIAFPGRNGPQRKARSPVTGTACSSSTGAARAGARASPTRGAGGATRTSRPRSPTCGAGRTSTRTGSAASGSPSAAS